jgi:predicted nuclease of restriction endonuclease-like (RecB) superfamily
MAIMSGDVSRGLSILDRSGEDFLDTVTCGSGWSIRQFDHQIDGQFHVRSELAVPNGHVLMD